MVIISFLWGCDKLFEYTTYSANVSDGKLNTNQKNLTLLEQQESFGNPEKFSVAFISDNHKYYNSLIDALESINENQDIELIIHGGDMTDGGMLKEYDLFYDAMEDYSDLPYFPVIGNHDCLANGRNIYNDMYGDENFSFSYKNCYFIFWNDVRWEVNNEEPDFDWLYRQLKSSDEKYNHVFVVAHIPPFGDQFTFLYREFYERVLDSFNVDLSIHGHQHEYSESTIDSTDYLVIGATSKDGYFVMDVDGKEITLKRKTF